jgi:hypothetical protein
VHQIRTVLVLRKAAEEQLPFGRELLKFVQDNGGERSSASGLIGTTEQLDRFMQEENEKGEQQCFVERWLHLDS